MSFDAITLALAKSYTDQHSGGSGGGIQPNWNQNDETAPDYVKNRPFYEETTEIEMLPETSFEIVAENTKAIISDSFPYTFEVGQDYTVTLDGEAKTYTAVDIDGVIGIASLSFEEVMKGNGWACAAFEGRLILRTRDTSIVGTHTISISGPVTNIYKIDEKYLGKITFKMDKINPVGEGSFSLNRKANTNIGHRSFAEGSGTTARGFASHAEGESTVASGDKSHAEGYYTTASGFASHAEGYYTTAKGTNSHAEGCNTIASGNYSHVEGQYNEVDSSNKYVHIIGSGTSNDKRKNIHTVDWSGNAWYSGEVGCTKLRLNSSTNGSTNKKVITVDDDGKIYVDGVDSSGSNEEYIERFTQKIFDTDNNLIGVNFSRYKIKDNAFKNNSTLTSVDFANGLSEIGNYAFTGCTNLALTSLPNSITSIGVHAFKDCTNLALTSLPENLTIIKSSAFWGCKKLALTSLPNGVTEIDNDVFDGCTNLTTITFKGTPTSIYSTAFSRCTNLTTINVPWAEGAVANAPWGATNATINYNYTGE